MKKYLRAFTLVELLIVIAIIAVLTLIVYPELNPEKRIMDARNVKRTADVNSILTAVHMAINENNGSLPSNLTLNMTERQLGTGSAAVNECGNGFNPTTDYGTICNVAASTSCVNLMTGTINLSKYLSAMPVDPLKGTKYTSVSTGYSVAVDTNGIVTVKACGAENNASISAAR